MRSGVASAGGLRLAGNYRLAPGKYAYTGHADVIAAQLPPAIRARFPQAAAAARGTPVGPLADRAAHALAAAATDFRLGADIIADQNVVHVTRASVVSASGARATLSGGDGVAINDAGWRLGGRLR